MQPCQRFFHLSMVMNRKKILMALSQGFPVVYPSLNDPPLSASFYSLIPANVPIELYRYELFVGQPPFYTNSVYALIRHIIKVLWSSSPVNLLMVQEMIN